MAYGSFIHVADGGGYAGRPASRAVRPRPVRPDARPRLRQQGPGRRAADLPVDHRRSPRCGRRRAAGRRGALAGVRARQRPGGAGCLARPRRIAPIAWSGCPTTGTGDRSAWRTCSAGTARSRHGGPWPGNVTRTSLPSGPSGETRECLQAALVLVAEGPDRIAILFRGADPESDRGSVSVEVVASNGRVAAAAHREAARAGARAQRATAATSCPSAAACSANEAHCCASTSDPG